MNSTFIIFKPPGGLFFGQHFFGWAKNVFFERISSHGLSIGTRVRTGPLSVLEIFSFQHFLSIKKFPSLKVQGEIFLVLIFFYPHFFFLDHVKKGQNFFFPGRLKKKKKKKKKKRWIFSPQVFS